jgi:hypothetical protein
MVSGFDDWVYRHLFTITVNYSSSHSILAAEDPLRSASPSTTNSCETESYVTTDGQSASASWNKAPFWRLGPDLYYCLTVAGLLIWGAHSDERAGLMFTIAAAPRSAVIFGSESRRTRGHNLLSQIRGSPKLEGQVPVLIFPRNRVAMLYSPFSSPPKTRRATVEVFGPASTRV